MVSICEVGPRDGLQNETAVLSPAIRAELCRQLAAAGLRRIEAVSFVRDDRVPAMAGAEEVLARSRNGSDVTWAGLVLNEHGYERAVAAGVDEVRYAFPVTDTFAKRNQGMTVVAAVDLAARLVERARSDGLAVTVTLSAAFGCPYEGQVPVERVAALANEVAAAGPDELVLADSIGVGLPAQVRALVEAVGAGDRVIGCHFHDTRGTGCANARAAVESGVTVLDAAVGGLGGCPFAPGAPGNVATEVLVRLLHEMGHETGIDVEKLGACARWLTEQLRRPAKAPMRA